MKKCSERRFLWYFLLDPLTISVPTDTGPSCSELLFLELYTKISAAIII